VCRVIHLKVDVADDLCTLLLLGSGKLSVPHGTLSHLLIIRLIRVVRHLIRVIRLVVLVLCISDLDVDKVIHCNPDYPE
jgi:hypothetical protein